MSSEESSNRPILSDQDIETLIKLKTRSPVRISAESNRRRVALIDRLLTEGATAESFERLANRELIKSLMELLSYLPRDIVKKWTNARTSERDGGDLTYLMLTYGHLLALRLLFDYGANYQTRSDKGLELHHYENCFQLLYIRRAFDEAATGRPPPSGTSIREIGGLGYNLANFLATVHARNAEGCTILQVALLNGHSRTLGHIVASIVERLPKNFVLDPSDTMTWDRLIDSTKIRLKDVIVKLKRLINENECGEEEAAEKLFGMTLDIFKSAARVLQLWREYEAGLDHFRGQVHLTIVEETLEAFGYQNDDNSTAFELRAARYHENWRKSNGTRKAKDFVIEIVKKAIIVPIEAFLATVYGTKLHEAATKLRDLDQVRECIEVGAALNLIDRDTDNTLLHRAISAGDEALAILLLDNGADTRQPGHLPPLLQVAIQSQRIDVIEALLCNFDHLEISRYVDNSWLFGPSALKYATMTSQFDMVKLLLKYQATRDRSCDDHILTPVIIKRFFELIDDFFWSASNGDEDCLRRLRDLPDDELMAVCHCCDEDGYNLAQIARINRHHRVASEIHALMLARAADTK